MTHSKNLQDLIQTVAKETAIEEDQAAAAVSSTLRYLTARLPSPIVGQLHEHLQTDPDESVLTNPQTQTTGKIKQDAS